MEVKLTLSKNYRNVEIGYSRNRGMLSERFTHNYFRERLKGGWCVCVCAHTRAHIWGGQRTTLSTGPQAPSTLV